jgi:hypothetical protein
LDYSPQIRPVIYSTDEIVNSRGRATGLPVGDEGLVGAFGVFDEVAFAAPGVAIFVVEARPVAVRSRCTGGELEPAALAGVETGPSEDESWVLGGQVPAQDGHPAGGGDDRDLEPAACLDPLEEGSLRPGCPGRGPGGLDQHAPCTRAKNGEGPGQVL